MRKPLILTLAFIVSMVLGVVLLPLIIPAIGFVQIASNNAITPVSEP
jgi:hypothetical protein